MSELEFQTSAGNFQLHRLPRRERELLRAWDAADEYLLQTLEEQSIQLQRPLICNDSFGALCVALHRFNPINWSDSWLAQQACRENLLHNDIPAERVEYLSSMQLPASGIDLVLLKVPKSLALLEHQLISLKPLLAPGCRFLIAGMAKGMPASLWKIIERIIGPSKTSPALKKAKVITLSVDPTLAVQKNPYPTRWKLEQGDLTLINHATVFSREKLDIGTRFLLQNMPQTAGAGEIIDLGCGNGVLGLLAAQQNPEALLHFVDESYMAIASARENYQQLKRDAALAQFHVSDGLNEFAAQSADLILCNPPFHHQQAVGDTLALSMFEQAARVLRPGAELWVVANRHLDYHKKLTRWFGTVELFASNPKFVILKASNA
ncbi:MAG: methyltransferase [Gammaproteobacteria bacterium]|nr:methyltransferase [Gammaproteobacteria bacterium]MBL6998387.1 methyltransferase [Gammaproteobacteria bacterium]